MNWYLIYFLNILLDELSILKNDLDAQKLIPIIKLFQSNNDKKIKEAISELIKMCDNKESENKYANFLLATCYKVEFGIESNLENSFKLYQRSSNQKYVHAMRGFALCNLESIGIESNADTIKLGLELLKEAVKLNDSFSMVELAEIYINGEVVPKNDEKGLELLARSSDLGNPRAAFALSIEFEKHKLRLENCTDKKVLDEALAFLKKAFMLCEQAARHEHPEALFRMGRYYYEGKRVTRDLNKSVEYLVKAIPLLQAHDNVQMADVGEKLLQNILLEMNPEDEFVKIDSNVEQKDQKNYRDQKAQKDQKEQKDLTNADNNASTINDDKKTKNEVRSLSLTPCYENLTKESWKAPKTIEINNNEKAYYEELTEMVSELEKLKSM